MTFALACLPDHSVWSRKVQRLTRPTCGLLVLALSMLAGPAATADSSVCDNVFVGDLNNDNQVDDADFVEFANAYNPLPCDEPLMPVLCPSDFNGDGFVNDADVVTFATGYNTLLCE